MFYNYEFTATNTRLSYAGDKGTYASVGGTIFGFLQPVDVDMNIVAIKIQGQAYEFICDKDEDIKANDMITVTDFEANSNEYSVRGVSIFRLGGVNFLKCTLELSVKE